MIRLVKINTLNFELIYFERFLHFIFWQCYLDSSKSNFLRSQLVAGYSTPATHYPFLPDLLLSLIIYLKLTWHVHWFLWICPFFSEPEHLLAISQWTHVSWKGFALFIWGVFWMWALATSLDLPYLLLMISFCSSINFTYVTLTFGEM